MMKWRYTIAALGAVLALGGGLLASPAQAGYVVTLAEVGGDVVATGSGPIDLTGLNNTGVPTIFAAVVPTFGIINTGPAMGVLTNTYSGPITGPANFGGGAGGDADTGSGDLVGISPLNSTIAVPVGYVSGAPLSDTSTYLGETFLSLGATPGTYEWSWGTGPNQNFTLIIPSTAVPEPASAALLLAGLAGLGFMRWRSGKQA